MSQSEKDQKNYSRSHKPVTGVLPNTWLFLQPNIHKIYFFSRIIRLREIQQFNKRQLDKYFGAGDGERPCAGTADCVGPDRRRPPNTT